MSDTDTTTATSDSGQTLVERVVAALDQLDLPSTPGPDGSIGFVVGEQPFIAQCSNGSPELLRIYVTWGLGELDPPALVRRLVACNDVNGALLTVKVGITESAFLAAGEHVVFAGVDLRALIAVSTREVAAGLEAFQKRVAELDAEVAGS